MESVVVHAPERFRSFGIRTWGNVRHMSHPEQHAAPHQARTSGPHLAAVPNNVVQFPQSWRIRMRKQWPSLSVLAASVAAVAAIAIDFRLSVWLLAGALGWAFALRLTLPKRRIGWLEVRRKRTDLICLGLLLFGVVSVALFTPSS